MKEYVWYSPELDELIVVVEQVTARLAEVPNLTEHERVWLVGRLKYILAKFKEAQLEKDLKGK